MINSSELETIKRIAPVLVNTIPRGMLIAVTDKNEVTWRAASRIFDVPAIGLGTPVRVGGAPYLSMQRKQTAEEKVPRSAYGTRLIMTSIPILDNGEANGSVTFITPRLHPVAQAFDDFAPMMANMFPGGAFLYMTDLEKIGRRQGSEKFDLPQVKVGTMITDEMAARQVIKSKKAISFEQDARHYGIPVMVVNYPCFDEDDPDEVVATFGIVVPRQAALTLRSMSHSLSSGLGEIASAIQQMAASSSQITSNEHQLNSNIKDIYRISEDINSVLGFIKQIADETKMLGLNAAIEAARAGEVGRGFGVVAEEIRKLSDESRETVTKIRNLTQGIKETVDITLASSKLTLRSSEDQAAASEEISASVQEITSLSDQLERIADEL